MARKQKLEIEIVSNINELTQEQLFKSWSIFTDGMMKLEVESINQKWADENIRQLAYERAREVVFSKEQIA